MRTNWHLWGLFIGGLIAFALLAWRIDVEDSTIWQIDRETAKAAKAHADDSPGLLLFAREVTHAGAVQAMTVMAVIGSLVLWMCNQPKLAAVWIVAAALGAMLNISSKELIQRERPGKEVLRDKGVSEGNHSFPSGHAMGSMIGFGSLAYVGVVLLRRRWEKLAVVCFAAAMIALISWTRIYLRAHWCSDVAAGWALGLSWLTCCIGVSRATLFGKK